MASKAAGRRRSPKTGKARAAKPRAKIGPMGIRTAPKGDRFYPAEMALRDHALGMPESREDFPWGHRAFRVCNKVFLFLAWDDGVFSLTVKLPQSQTIALMLAFTEPRTSHEVSVVQATKSAAGPARTRSRATVTSGVTLERVRKKKEA